MKVLLINGSPRKNGCTHTALCEVQKGLAEMGVQGDIVWLGNGTVQQCIGCRACKTKGNGCVLNSDVADFVEKYADYDGFVFGSPVYYAGANGGLCAFMDRLYYSSAAHFAYKPAAAVVSCRRGGAASALDRLNKYFTINNQPVVPSQYWNEVHGTTPEEVQQDKEGMQIMRTLGRNMAWMVSCFAAGAAAGVLPPKAEEIPQRTNFIR